MVSVSLLNKPLDEKLHRPHLVLMNEVKIDAMPVRVSLELGTADVKLKNIKDLDAGSIITLKTLAGEPVLIKANGMPYALGEVVIVDENYGVRVTDLIPEQDRVKYIGEYETVPYSEVWRDRQI